MLPFQKISLLWIRRTNNSEWKQNQMVFIISYPERFIEILILIGWLRIISLILLIMIQIILLLNINNAKLVIQNRHVMLMVKINKWILLCLLGKRLNIYTKIKIIKKRNHISRPDSSGVSTSTGVSTKESLNLTSKLMDSASPTSASRTKSKLVGTSTACATATGSPSTATTSP